MRRPSISDIKKYGRRVINDERGQFIVRSITPQTPSTEALFRMTPNEPDNGGTLFYGFDSKRAQGPWTITNLPTSNYDGTGCPLVTIHAGNSQFNFGWDIFSLNHTFVLGESMFVRTRLRWPNDQPSGTFGCKFHIFGADDGSPIGNSRSMFHIRPKDIYFLDYHVFNIYGDGTYHICQPDDYGITLPGNIFNGDYVAGGVGRNVDGPPAISEPGICMTAANRTAGNPSYVWDHAPQGGATAAGAPAVNGRYWIQYECVSGVAGVGHAKVWCNSNNYNLPQGRALMDDYFGTPTGWDCNDWGGIHNVGAYLENATAADVSFQLEAFEIGLTFDPNWYQV